MKKNYSYHVQEYLFVSLVLLPGASFGLRVLSSHAFVCVCVCVSLCQSLAGLRYNTATVQARIVKCGPNMPPLFFFFFGGGGGGGGNWPWPTRSNLTYKSEFTPFWAIPHHNSLPIQARITKVGPDVANSLVKIPIVWVAIDLDLQGQILFKNSNFLVSPLLEIHNHHIITTEPWIPRLLHRSDCFMFPSSVHT